MIYRAKVTDAQTVARLAVKMWGLHDEQELTKEFELLIAREDVAVFLCLENDKVIGFSQCQLRRDYVEGTCTSPVGYLEGVFIEKGYRHRGYGKMLVSACEQWVKDQGCSEFASDCELHNQESLAFHLGIGFAEANRIICFTKKL